MPIFNLTNGNDTFPSGAINSGDDTINGLDGDDVINAGLGADTVDGGEGNDRIHGQDGADSLDGGNGDDTLSDLTIADDGSGNALITLADGSTITLSGFDFNNLDSSDFIFGP